MSQTQELKLAPAFKGPMVTVSLVFILLPVILNLLMLPRLVSLPSSLNKYLALGIMALPLLFSAAMGWLLRATLRETRLNLSSEGLEYHSPLLSLAANWEQAEALVPSDLSSQRWNLKLNQPARIIQRRLFKPPEPALLQIPLFPFAGHEIESLELQLKTFQPKLSRSS
ncbi:hypothetical protein COW36_24760 [bacterium (Candidatus Blackallbacteria) CG17_big_fil_post_rev_8_21_14_2_50_48_46]|uniref:Uncharacterized protein n=1 Tax=bacterium (Candidatus Blackallbacteria) CG17_big_fil_post_rev_8_21_14_2_50_48_46 TaxID=2014261 RepID=A0A2M7FX99_9BACT|nr:MAG: hypothetical protein COW64_19700 [bacterium (Candidatus Blackallbacteria) CG18_big_fil_WC_8_21_14_2_50_49_26]PIW13880.1 MAG: hypothetical protein COW36_24760 [bacterium (Candidatus Blackallbacteria) CG17_big_fil_post_rev_8_21_14_2_50_48_46]PIW45106.1 MAG: hypothetical protein COW20_22390 [bacterium (Candidatus Blackallbacteria) CG13_big_fil_rev_8_21_14_2_50_49_14]